jgi:serine/threonine-protein kinase
MIGTVIHGQYRILELLGEGGMGEVYKALDVELERQVALKFLKTEFGDDRVLIQRFRDELRTLAGFNHPNIAMLYTTFTWNARPVMVMELVEGETLLNMVNRRGPIPAQVCVPLARQALAGVGEAHRKMIVHRDLKPANLMLNRDGVVKVMDFGIAKMQNAPGLTRSNAAIGTCLYMAPEQIRGSVDARTDIYAMGVTLYELLAGRVPFQGSSEYDIQTAHIIQDPEPPDRFYPHIPRAVTEAVLRALAKNPAARFQTAEEFSMALAEGGVWPAVPARAEYVPAEVHSAPTIAADRNTGADAQASRQGHTPPVPTPTPQPTTWRPEISHESAPEAQTGSSFATVTAGAAAMDLDGSRVDVAMPMNSGANGRSWRVKGALAAAALLLALGGGYGIYAVLSPTPSASVSGTPNAGTQAKGIPETLAAVATPQAQTHGPEIGVPAKPIAAPNGSGARQAGAVAGRWTGVYERCDDNSRTQATLDINQSTDGAVSGTLLLRSAGGAVERCSLSGSFAEQRKSLMFSVVSCGGLAAPAYLSSSHQSLLRLSGGQLTGDVEPQDACVTASFKKM